MMIRVTFFSFFIIILAADIRDSNIDIKIDKALQTANLTDASLLLDLKTFINYNGIRRTAMEANETKAALRAFPKYILPQDKDMRRSQFDIMRQAVYATQERMLALDPILKKYENDQALRMSFIYNRLRQLIIDMRRIYTVSLVNVKSSDHPFYKFIYWYSHLVRKFFDVLYIVEHVIVLYTDLMESKMKEQAAEENTVPGESISSITTTTPLK